MKEEKFTFIDLFAGIGGFRIGLESIGGKCVFSAEIDSHACEMYKANFKEDPYCDITTLDPKTIPNFDVLCAGFPCQPFSISGKQLGFLDKTRGTLFFNIIEILKIKKPKVVFLENVKNLEIHDNGNTLRVILESLKSLGYVVEYKILNAKDFGVPQNRERIIIIGSKEGKKFNFENILKVPSKPMKNFLDKKGNFEYLDSKDFTLIDKKYVKEQKSGLIFVGYRNKNMRKNGVRENTEHLSRVHRQVNRIYSSEGTHPTISSQEKNGRYFILHNGKVRKLTINECFKFFGFPSTFKKVGRDSLLYERIGNSVCVPMIKEIGKEIYNQLLKSTPNL